MTASLLDGKYVACVQLESLKLKVKAYLQDGHQPPGLAVILLGDDPASHIYVKNKRKSCIAVGFNTYAYDLPDTTSESSLLELIDTLNTSVEVHGILVQLPLPSHINSRAVIERILPTKDVDGFHPYNLGRLAQGTPNLRPCTPYGIMQLLEYYELSVHGKEAVVIGASNIVGRPMALELLRAKATVTVCHRATQRLEEHVRLADIVIIAAGNQDILPVDWFHKNQIVIDVGIHRQADGTLRGDVDFNQVKDKVAWITPVPGGVGPMTISALLENTFHAATQNT
jgi:methylenetetrahydrofolate dehydrogenase (NADP+) / methenyltetrahydrofolate cyclohydrolase